MGLIPVLGAPAPTPREQSTPAQFGYSGTVSRPDQQPAFPGALPAQVISNQPHRERSKKLNMQLDQGILSVIQKPAYNRLDDGRHLMKARKQSPISTAGPSYMLATMVSRTLAIPT